MGSLHYTTVVCNWYSQQNITLGSGAQLKEVSHLGYLKDISLPGGFPYAPLPPTRCGVEHVSSTMRFAPSNHELKPLNLDLHINLSPFQLQVLGIFPPVKGNLVNTMSLQEQKNWGSNCLEARGEHWCCCHCNYSVKKDLSNLHLQTWGTSSGHQMKWITYKYSETWTQALSVLSKLATLTW